MPDDLIKPGCLFGTWPYTSPHGLCFLLDTILHGHRMPSGRGCLERFSHELVTSILGIWKANVVDFLLTTFVTVWIHEELLDCCQMDRETALELDWSVYPERRLDAEASNWTGIFSKLNSGYGTLKLDWTLCLALEYFLMSTFLLLLLQRTISYVTFLSLQRSIFMLSYYCYSDLFLCCFPIFTADHFSCSLLLSSSYGFVDGVWCLREEEFVTTCI
ncbi:hypothetical protein BU24DRAFT_182102 [Aaosphaeria arxii CBS 175.79]|uniref:Uncharacterized protein n=1 Tax=Aaosphaeria arxii CBS 175.79 TaxID=1450172 RepID=A0A6A5XTQ1_9PLEO|nr:uncharacterized protein BU24DRAFT_182102 [Aaosphaeria arxii CBS 175.79]KAF2015624.1 hypothetical protein BU24DRAFT_182102 [Aaosphaeria arxii CBS 175.79]